ncbi:winged helix-turn-helix transcriptional regulator [Kitasatospora sp. P5_F3]
MVFGLGVGGGGGLGLVVEVTEHSFGTLPERLPEFSPKVLTEGLHDLCERGLVDRQRLPGFLVRTRYALSGAGRALRPLLIEPYRTGEALRAGSLRGTGPATPS